MIQLSYFFYLFGVFFRFTLLLLLCVYAVYKSIGSIKVFDCKSSVKHFFYASFYFSIKIDPLLGEIFNFFFSFSFSYFSSTYVLWCVHMKCIGNKCMTGMHEKIKRKKERKKNKSKNSKSWKKELAR